jgi:hypothetical protein
MKPTIAIIGSHPRTRALFDYDRPDCDVWVFNEAISGNNPWVKRVDAVFQMHVPTIWRNPQNRNDPGHYDWLKNQTQVKTIYMQDVYPDVPASVRYPLDAVLALLNGDPDHFLSSSVPQAIALACVLGYKRIEVYGVAMETNTEYQWQREGVAFWKGFAMGRGIEFYFADETYRCGMYGYDTEVTIPFEVFGQRIAELAPIIEGLSKTYTDAAVQLNQAVDAFASGENDYDKLMPKVKALLEAGQALGVMDGARQESERYKQKAETMQATTGEFVFSRQEFEGSAAKLQDNLKETKTQFAALGGQLGMVHKSAFNAAKNSPKRAGIIDNYNRILSSYLAANNMMAVYMGAARENIQYMARLDKGIRAAGGEKSEAVLLGAQNA